MRLLPGPSPKMRALLIPDFFPCRATEMDVTMIGLQNAGKSSLLRVLAVCSQSFAQVFPAPTTTLPLFWLLLCISRDGSLIALRRAGNSRLSKLFPAKYRSLGWPLISETARFRPSDSTPSVFKKAM